MTSKHSTEGLQKYVAAERAGRVGNKRPYVEAQRMSSETGPVSAEGFLILRVHDASSAPRDSIGRLRPFHARGGT